MSERLIAATAVLLTALFVATPTYAQDHARNWEPGNVVAVTHVHIESNMTNAYMNDLNGLWRPFNEQQKKDGDVVDYNVYSNVSAREGEPDLILTVTYKNWAAFDRSPEYFEDISKKMAGSLDSMRNKAIDREELRKIGSTFTLQEMKFKD